jgi:hypothetical protein
MTSAQSAVLATVRAEVFHPCCWAIETSTNEQITGRGSIDIRAALAAK